jgi:hypothetical protein
VEDKDGEEGEVTPPPHSLPREVVPLLGDIFRRQPRIEVGARWAKQPWSEAGLLIGSSS